MRRIICAAHHGVFFENVCHNYGMPGNFIRFCRTRTASEGDSKTQNVPPNRKSYQRQGNANISKYIDHQWNTTCGTGTSYL